GLGEDGVGVGGAAAFLDVREVGLVRLGTRAGRGVVRVSSGGEPAARAVPGVRFGHVEGEGRLRLVPVDAEVDHRAACGGFAALRPAEGTGTHAGTSDGVATDHGWSLLSSRRGLARGRSGGWSPRRAITTMRAARHRAARMSLWREAWFWNYAGFSISGRRATFSLIRTPGAAVRCR